MFTDDYLQCAKKYELTKYNNTYELTAPHT